MHEGEKDGVDLCLWMSIKHDSAAKLYPLRIFYAERIRSLKLSYNGSLHDYIDRFQGLAILWRGINDTVQPEHRIVTQIVEQIKIRSFLDHIRVLRIGIPPRRRFAMQQQCCALTRSAIMPARPRILSIWR